jgi:hypothetical protein
MNRFIYGFHLALAILTIATFGVIALSQSRANTWRGTAPFCAGQCLPGEPKLAVSDCGNGACCWTGHKVLCGNSSTLCQALETRTSCVLFALICDNGYYGVSTEDWHSCSKYACGACLGLSSDGRPVAEFMALKWLTW